MKYLIEFTPIGSFSFSGETSFANPGETANRRSSYLADSELMPPQTTVLGTLRRAVLEWAELYKADGQYSDRQPLTELIGENAFSLNEKTFALGKIRSISGVFLTYRKGEQTQYLFPVPRNAVFPKEKSELISFHPMVWDAGKRMSDEQSLPDYNVKKGLLNGFVTIDVSSDDAASCISDIVAKKIFDAKIISQEAIFKKFPQTAIRQAENDDNKGFRIHHRVHFTSKHYAFAIVADLDSITPKQPLLVSMGARNSLFQVKASSLPETDEDSYTSESSCCLVILSPMNLPDDWRDMVDFSILLRQKIRQMKQKDSFSYRHDSTLRFFAAPGSVFYLKPNKKECFISFINNQTALCKAGFNQYFMLKEEAKQ